MNSVDAHGWVPLHYAASSGSTEVCQSLVQWRADVNFALPDFSTPLMLSVEEGHLPASRLLVDSGADLMCRDENGFTAQERCDPRIKVEVAKILLSPSSARTRKEQCAAGASASSVEAGLENLPPPAKAVDKQVDKSDPYAAILEKASQQYRMLPNSVMHEVQAVPRPVAN